MKTLKFNKKFYDLQAIKSSINDFSQSGSFKIDEKKNYFWVQIKTEDKDMEDILPYEFANYVLNETISRRV